MNVILRCENIENEKEKISVSRNREKFLITTAISYYQCMEVIFAILFV